MESVAPAQEALAVLDLVDPVALSHHLETSLLACHWHKEHVEAAEGRLPGACHSEAGSCMEYRTVCLLVQAPELECRVHCMDPSCLALEALEEPKVAVDGHIDPARSGDLGLTVTGALSLEVLSAFSLSAGRLLLIEALARACLQAASACGDLTSAQALRYRNRAFQPRFLRLEKSAHASLFSAAWCCSGRRCLRGCRFGRDGPPQWSMRVDWVGSSNFAVVCWPESAAQED